MLEAVTENPAETQALGRLFGELASPGLVVLLNGELGVGKTCFARGVATGLGVPPDEPVTSPSYTLLNVHQGRFPLYHFDLYRLTRVNDLEDLGYDEIAEGEGLTLLEWANRLADPPAASVRITIESLSGQGRRFRFEAEDAVGDALLNNFSGVVKRRCKPA